MLPYDAAEMLRSLVVNKGLTASCVPTLGQYLVQSKGWR